MIPVTEITYLFITYLRDNPCATAREIHEYIWENAESLKGCNKYHRRVIYDSNWRIVGYKQTKQFYSGKLCYLTSPYNSNMLTIGRKTKSRRWVKRYRNPEDKCNRFILTEQGLAASGALVSK